MLLKLPLKIRSRAEVSLTLCAQGNKPIEKLDDEYHFEELEDNSLITRARVTSFSRFLPLFNTGVSVALTASSKSKKSG